MCFSFTAPALGGTAAQSSPHRCREGCLLPPRRSGSQVGVPGRGLPLGEAKPRAEPRPYEPEVPPVVSRGSSRLPPGLVRRPSSPRGAVSRSGDRGEGRFLITAPFCGSVRPDAEVTLFGSCRFAGTLEIRSWEPLSFVLFQDCFVYLGFFEIPCEFQEEFFYFCRKCHRSLGRWGLHGLCSSLGAAWTRRFPAQDAGCLRLRSVL